MLVVEFVAIVELDGVGLEECLDLDLDLEPFLWLCALKRDRLEDKASS